MSLRIGKAPGRKPRAARARAVHPAPRPKRLASLVSALLARPAGRSALPLLLSTLAASHVYAQAASPNCSQAGTASTCTVPAGSYSAPLQQQAAELGGSLDITNYGTFAITNPPGGYGLNFVTHGADVGQGLTGGNAGQLTVNNAGGLKLTNGAGGWTWALLMQSIGGNGGPATSSVTGGTGGGVPYQLSFANSAPVTLSGYFPGGASGVEAQSKGGGSGIDNSDPGTGQAGNGGSGGDVQLTNNGAVTIGTSTTPTSGYYGARGVAALSTGAGGGPGSKNGGAAGGASGGVAVSNAAPVTLVGKYAGFSGYFGIAALSAGGDGAGTLTNNTSGGAGGGAGSAFVSHGAGDVLVVQQESSAASAAYVGAGVAALSTGGAGGSGYGHAPGGAGGGAGAATVAVTDASVTAEAPVWGSLPAIRAESTGGSGGAGTVNQDTSSGGAGGASGAVSVTVGTTLPTQRLIGTFGPYSPAINAMSRGGDGGTGADYNPGFNFSGSGGAGGAGGKAAAVTVSVQDSVWVATYLMNSAGIVASSYGGAGASGGLYGGGLAGNGGDGGAGGGSGNVTVTLGASLVTTAGFQSPGIAAYSVGGKGGTGGHSGDPFEATGGNGGDGGSGGAVAVTVGSGARITTTGATSPGILAQSFGNTGGAGGSADSLDAPPGVPGNGGSTGTISVQNAGKVETIGQGSPGILAQAISGDGGAGGMATSVFYGAGTSGGTPGQLADIGVTNTGLVYTLNAGSPGILVQSISGGGGAGGGASGAIVSVGGNAGAGANGGNASATVGGVVATQGPGSVGVQVQSIGGGGGTAGAASTDGVGIGGSGSTGGDGGQLTLTLNGSIATGGALSHGVLAQSIGGGGGSAGNSDSFIAIGGTGAATGNGGAVTIGSTGSVATSGSQAIGVLAQSIGGGGGSGGNATQGLVSVGGSASGGGNGGTVTINSAGAVTTAGDLAPGLLAMSVGGGGGVGGNATSYSAVVGVSVGGSGGAGGTGGTATVSASAGTDVKAYGSNAMGIAALSVGGGGGTGGSGYTLTGSTGFGASVAVGGSGGAGGAGGAATVSLNQARITTGLGATQAVDPATIPDGKPIPALPVSGYGAVALSVGGGGGVGGSAMAKTYVLDFPTSPEPGSPSFALSGAFAVGGSGGVAGNGGGATVNVANGTGILTYGNDSHGVLASSIGGGGGQGGDASATATSFGFKNLSRIGVPSGGTKDPGDLKQRPNYNFDLDVSVGGAGGAGGDGGAASVTIRGTDGVPDPAQSPPVVIQTLGDYAHGVHAQSVGGGGGNAGTGAGSTQNGTAAGTALTAAINVGASGGGGGTGGPVQVTQFAGSLIATAGDTAYGILAHSAGGGGGTSTGGSYQFGFPGLSALQPLGLLPEAHRKSYYDRLLTIFGGIYSSMTIKVGTDGAGGGDGGNVAVSIGGAVRTTGEAATAVFAQSVGGGGGVAGSAGSTGSSDNPTVIDDLKTVKQFANDLLAYPLDVITSLGGNNNNAAVLNLKDLFPAFNLNLSFGGTGGSAGDGGNVQVAVNGGEIDTTGDYAIGVQAQSVGGGGGAGGGAVAGGSSGFGNLMKINANFALGGSGGSGGMGGPVTVSLGGAKLSTKGYAAYGVQAQSVGGGGGLIGSAQTSSTGIFSLGASTTSGPASGGDGGTVLLSQVSTSVSTPALSTISTSGDAAHAAFLQSIGGGGGTAGEGWTGAVGTFSAFDSGTHQFRAGGDGAYGNGGLVQLPSSQAPWLAITTTGASAYGILAQSVGGGGGLVFTNPGLQTSNVIGGASTASANGGDVDLNLRDGSSIVTSGDGSTAILAQSVGGGGGIAGYASGAPLLYQATPADGVNSTTNGSGGAITINTGNTTIRTTGGAAHGIFAQSVGGGGGLSAGGDGVSVIAGSTGIAGSVGQGGTITVTQSGTISATGENSVGIAAQSVGPSGGGVIAITVNGAVTGGSGQQGAGVWVMDGATTSSLTINPGGSLSALSGVAATYTGGSTFNVYNYGTMTGSVSVAKTTGSGSGTVYNYGSWSNAAAAGDVVNHGTMLVGGPRSIGQGTITGKLAQSGTGTIVVDADFGHRQADLLTVKGDAQLAGKIKPVLVGGVRPGVALPVLTVEGDVTGTLKADSSSLFGFDVSRSGNQFLLSARSANFAPPSFGLTKALQAMAGHLDSIWNRGSATAYDALFGLLGNTADASPSAYSNQLRQLSPDATFAPGARGNARAQNFATSSLSCPVFEGSTAMLVETQCAWLRVTETRTDQSPGNGVSDFKIDSTTAQAGGQFQLGNGWFLGGSAAYADDRLSSSDGLSSGKGESGYGALTLKYQTGPWLFAGTAFGGAGNFDTRRTINLPGFQAVATGKPNTSSYGLLARASYTIGHEAFYLRPSLSLSGIHVRTGAYQESGAGALDLSVDAASQTTWAATPMLELGGRVPVGSATVLRPYVSAGVSFLSNGEWQQTARLVGAPVGSDSFTTTIPLDSVVARVSAGVQLYTHKGFDLRLQYDGEFSRSVTANGGSVVASYRF